MGQAKGNPTEFAVGDRVRYTPGTGTYGYEDVVDRDGHVFGTVIAILAKRVRIKLEHERGTLRKRIVAVDAASLQRAL